MLQPINFEALYAEGLRQRAAQQATGSGPGRYRDGRQRLIPATASEATSAPSVAVLGAGSWGTALAALIARHGHARPCCGAVMPTAIAAIDRGTRTRATCPASPCRKRCAPPPIWPPRSRGADLVLVVVPSHAFAETLRALAPHRPAHAGVAWATKGFEPGSGRFLHEVADEVLGVDVPLAVVTGPSFAKEVAAGLPTALTVHSDDEAFAQAVADVLHGPAFRAYTGDDMLGAELGGAMKNVLAVATGVADGMDLGLNARAGLITRGLNEMLRLNVAHRRPPGNPDGPGRPRRPGADLHRRPVAQPPPRAWRSAAASRSTTRCARSARWSNRCRPPTRSCARPTGTSVELPIASDVRDVLHGAITPAEGLRRLLAREQKAEYPSSLFD